MIEYIKLLRNIGTFNSDSAAVSLSLKRLTLIYADNGRGKTTLAAVLRSLGTGNSDPILDRHRLGSGDPPHVILRSCLKSHQCRPQGSKTTSERWRYPLSARHNSHLWCRSSPDLTLFKQPLRVACPDCFPPGKLLGPFIGDCRNKGGRPDEILSEDTILELHNIVEYGNRFHHDTNQAWQTEEINSTELLGYVKRTLAFVGPPRV